MFTVYHSNRLNILKTLTATLIANNPLRDPFQPEVILVQSNGMAQWIQMELATHFGITANIDFPSPDNFIWQMFTRVLPDLPKEDMFTKSIMTWRLMALLPHLCQQENFTTIRKYLSNDDDDKRKVFQFSARIEDLFNQYLIYRPDWLKSWQRGEMIDGLGEDQRWQAPLWRALVTATEQAKQSLWHRASVHQNFIQFLMQSQTRPPGLPDRVFICGISALPPIYLKIFQVLGRHIDIHMLFTNPCRYYWGDICDHVFLEQLPYNHCRHDQQQMEKALFQRPEETCALFDVLGKEQKTGNPLLASWGKQGSDNLYLLTQMDDIIKIDAFVEPSSENLLNLVQRDILNFENHATIGIKDETLTYNNSKRLLQLNDRSLSLHVCHSLQREVEVLHDSLLAMIVEDPTLHPRDVIVAAADIDCYTPAIKAVFGNASSKRYLPFTISDRRMRHLHPILPAFISLLELLRSRFVAEQVLSLLEVPAIAARFAINEQGLQLLRLWVAESGIRWGLDKDTLYKLMLPTTNQHTWQFGLSRMLLGYAMDSESGDWQGILPYDGSSGLIADLVGKLAEFLIRLHYWRDQLAKPRTVDAWLNCAHEIIKDFFTPDTEAEVALALLENHWKQMLQYGLHAEYDQPISITLLQNELASRLDQERISHQFLSGAINFCTLMPMRSIPFRVVCLLGMNDGIYPRTLLSTKFDLMEEQLQRGDCCRRDDDRYIFLEALLSAQQRLYISFIGRSIQDNTQRYPSILVNELSDYITQSFYLPGDEYADAESSANRVRTHLWQWHSRMPFAQENFLPGSELQSFADEWLPAASVKGKPQSDFVVPLTVWSCKEVALDKLLDFYRHPVRAWFVQRLAISFHEPAIKIATNEPFVIDSITRYQLNNRLVNAIINGESTDRLFYQVRAAGLLPYGAFGDLYWAKQCQEMITLSKQVLAWRLPETFSVEVFLTLSDEIILSGWLPQVQRNGLLRWRPGTLSAKDGLLLWIEHLAYCAMGGKGESRMFGTHGEWHFAPLSTCQAKAFLLSLVSDYYQGMTSPLLLLPRASGAWISNCYNPMTQTINRDEKHQQYGRDKLIQAWQGNSQVPGERKDPYLQRLIHQLEEQHIKTIISLAERYLLPPFMFNMTKSKSRNTERKSKESVHYMSLQ